MSSTLNNGVLTYTCDSCGEEAEVDVKSDHGGDYKAAWQAMKQDEGWRAFKDENDEWKHKCGNCLTQARRTV